MQPVKLRSAAALSHARQGKRINHLSVGIREGGPRGSVQVTISRSLEESMADTVIRPSLKFIKVGFIVTILLVIGAVIVHYEFLEPKGQPPWLPACAALLLLW